MKVAGFALALALLAPGCSTDGKRADVAASPQCPAAWKAGWQNLANRIDAPVYCPTWMPSPLDARIGGEWTDINSVSRDGSYLISFLWHEKGSGDVHVNFRGYPGRTGMPRCKDLTTNKLVPCFSDRRGTQQVSGIRASVYTANQGADMWHILYGWRFHGSLYAISEHVTPPYTYGSVVQHLNRMLRSLVLVEPRK
jgi:hypothetical protein